MKQPILVKLKMKFIYKAFLWLVAILVVLTSSIGIMYMFYEKVIDYDGNIEVNGALSINYIDGKKFELEGVNKEVIEFSVSNSSDITTYYNLAFIKVRGSGKYKLLYNDEIILEGNLKSIDEIDTDYISIAPNETRNYTLEINSEENLKGNLNIRMQNGKINTFADLILKNNEPTESTLTKVGVEAAIEDEGLIKSSDDIGISYYFRGNIQNNYVSFGNMLWRIVRINGDGTVRLILNNLTDTVSSYYSNDFPSYEYENSNINDYLENWLQVNLREVTSYIANSKYCSDISHDDANNYYAYTRVMTNKIPTLNCLGTSFRNNIGLITVDEVMLAGSAPDVSNQSYYLYNSAINDYWYTMSGAKSTDTTFNTFMVASNGSIQTNITGNLYRGVRPVINLIKNIEMTGDGTINNPYTLINK